jgi:mRNA interferase MazF
MRSTGSLLTSGDVIDLDRECVSEGRVVAEVGGGLAADSSAQCQHIRSVSVDRVETMRGNVGSVTLSEIRQVLVLILDID